MASGRTYFNMILLSTFCFIIDGEISGWFPETELLHRMEEKITHLHFYFYDTVSGKKPSSIQIAGPKDKGFGTVMMADEPLRAGPETTSKLIGKAQGMYALAAQEKELGFLMVFSCVFLEGKYNGSTLSLLGRNAFQAVREMPIVGGTGLFRFARGYAQAKTYLFDVTTGDAIVEYNVFVIHH